MRNGGLAASVFAGFQGNVMKIYTGLATAVVLAAGTVQALAFDVGGADNGIYFSGFGGPSFSQLVKGFNSTAGSSYKARMKTPGYLVGGAIGLRLNENLRAEAELAYRRYSLKNVTYPGFAPVSLSGYADAISFMGNLWYDLPLGGKVTPYAGGGLGLAYTGYSDKTTPLKDHDTGFIFQLGLGAKWALSEKISLDIGYRFRGIPGLKFSSPAISVRDNDYYGHNVIVGVTFSF